MMKKSPDDTAQDSALNIKTPVCHFKKMEFMQSDNIEGVYVAWWECKVCGHVKSRGEQYT